MELAPAVLEESRTTCPAATVKSQMAINTHIIKLKKDFTLHLPPCVRSTNFFRMSHRRGKITKERGGSDEGKEDNEMVNLILYQMLFKEQLRLNVHSEGQF